MRFQKLICTFESLLGHHKEFFMNHFKIVTFFAEQFGSQSYLEIGCAENATFKRVKCSIKVGVDPHSGGTERMTSDNFFAQNTEKFDLIFIDGLHLHEQVIRDVNNSLNILNENGTILVHDCNPYRYTSQLRYAVHGEWNGDVWKAICFFRQRKDLKIYVTKEYFGVGIIRKQRNKNPLVLKTKIKDLTWFNLVKNRKEFLNLRKWENIKSYYEKISQHQTPDTSRKQFRSL